MRPDPTKLIFLSYAREDADAAQRIADALIGFRFNVWIDRDKLRTGDGWESEIRRKISECTYFIPVISKNTEKRSEGWFRREWNLADDRSKQMASGTKFILPVAIDYIPTRRSSVPTSFLVAQWTVLQEGEVTPDFIGQLLEIARVVPEERTDRIEQNSPVIAGAKIRPIQTQRIILAFLLAAVVTSVGLFSWQAWQEKKTDSGSAQSTNLTGSESRPSGIELISLRQTIDERTPIIIGFVVPLQTSQRVLIRASGPSLARMGLTDAVRDPVLSIFKVGESAQLVSRNSGNIDGIIRNGGSLQETANVGPVTSLHELNIAAARLGLEPFKPDHQDPGVILDLDGGAYTVHVTSASNTKGAVLLTIAHVP